MGNCVTNVPYSDGDFTSSNGGGYGQGVTETAYGYTVDFSGNWGYNANATSSNSYANKYKEKIKKAGNALGVDWRLIAALAMQESTMNPNAENKESEKNTAAGLFQFTNAAWRDNAPNEYKNSFDKKKDVDASVSALINLWKKLFEKIKNAKTVNDKIALAIQSHHDGAFHIRNIESINKWEEYSPAGNDYGQSYLQSVIKHYKDFCK